jgi:ubiquitin-protein ligase
MSLLIANTISSDYLLFTEKKKELTFYEKLILWKLKTKSDYIININIILNNINDKIIHFQSKIFNKFNYSELSINNNNVTNIKIDNSNINNDNKSDLNKIINNINKKLNTNIFIFLDYINNYLETVDINFEEDENDDYDMINDSDYESDYDTDVATNNFIINNSDDDDNDDDDDYYSEFKTSDNISDNLAQKIKREQMLKKKANESYNKYDELKIKNNKQLFCKNSIIQLILNEINNINDNIKNISIDTIDDNIFNLSIKFNYFEENMQLNNNLMVMNEKYNYNYIEINIKLNKLLYPHYPPDILFIKPRLLNNLDKEIISMEYFKIDKWNPTNSLKYTISSIQKILDKFGEIDISNNSYLPIESELIILSKLSNIDIEIKNNISIDFINLDKEISNNSNKNNNGIGYSNNKSSKWDVNKYIEIQKEKINNIAKSLNNICKNINENLLPEILNSSCIFTFIKKNIEGLVLFSIDAEGKGLLYEYIFDIILKICKLPELFNNTFKVQNFNIRDLLKDLYNECIETKKKYSMHLNISSNIKMNFIIDKIIEIYNLLKNMINENITDNKILTKEYKTENQYINIMKPLLHLEGDILNTSKYYSLADQKMSIENNMKFLIKEICSFRKNLPLSYNSSIYIRSDSNNIQYLRCLIIAPDDTPYENGCFFFDIFIPKEYPNQPPKFHFLTTGNATVRFNPNLYKNGKVCLSLLGTWSGEAWSPFKSSILQVLISIQSFIFRNKPYFNEPCYQRDENTVNGEKNSENYNKNVMFNTIKWAMIDIINNINKYEIFKDIIKNHFSIKKNDILNQAKKWMIKYDKINKLYNELEKSLYSL